MKASGLLAEAFAKAGIDLQWLEFPSGPPLLEALNSGSIDLGHTGDSPPLFAQAAGVPFYYVAVSSPSPGGSAILVLRESNLSSGTELKGKRVGFTKGTSAHAMVLRYLESQGLSLEDIRVAYLSPAEGRIALESGSIDAWSIWDPYLAAAEQSGNVRVLAAGAGIVDGREYYLCSHTLHREFPDSLTLFFEEMKRIKQWAKEHQDRLNEFMSSDTGLPLDVVALAESRRNRYETLPMSDEVIASQQDLANRYFQLGLIPKSIDVRNAVLQDTTNRNG